MVDDGIQPPVELSCKDRNIMAATFIRFLHKNIGWFSVWEQQTSIHVYLFTPLLCVGGLSGNTMFSVGGSETFQDKVNFFQRELRHIHSKKPRTKTCLKIVRHSILDSVSTALLSYWTLHTYKCSLCVLSIPFSPWRPHGTSLCLTGVRTSRLCFRMKKVKETSRFPLLSPESEF